MLTHYQPNHDASARDRDARSLACRSNDDARRPLGQKSAHDADVSCRCGFRRPRGCGCTASFSAHHLSGIIIDGTRARQPRISMPRSTITCAVTSQTSRHLRRARAVAAHASAHQTPPGRTTEDARHTGILIDHDCPTRILPSRRSPWALHRMNPLR